MILRPDAKTNPAARAADIKCFSMFHVDKWGIGKVVEMALDHVNKERNRPIQDRKSVV